MTVRILVPESQCLLDGLMMSKQCLPFVCIQVCQSSRLMMELGMCAPEEACCTGFIFMSCGSCVKVTLVQSAGSSCLISWLQEEFSSLGNNP